MTSRHPPRRLLRERKQAAIENGDDAIARVMLHGRPHIAAEIRKFQETGLNPIAKMLMVVDAESIMYDSLGGVAGLSVVDRTTVVSAFGQLEARSPEIVRAREIIIAMLQEPPACGHPQLLLALPTVGRVLCAVCEHKILEPDRTMS